MVLVVLFEDGWAITGGVGSLILVVVVVGGGSSGWA